mmetsp:Transcript_16478/g.37615  ORF Transcript_16478/g.37615 Transcript_16478/m.37615 type:complete len:290 (+) Transcript_16478:878-1747(+)
MIPVSLTSLLIRCSCDSWSSPSKEVCQVAHRSTARKISSSCANIRSSFARVRTMSACKDTIPSFSSTSFAFTRTYSMQTSSCQSKRSLISLVFSQCLKLKLAETNAKALNGEILSVRYSSINFFASSYPTCSTSVEKASKEKIASLKMPERILSLFVKDDFERESRRNAEVFCCFCSHRMTKEIGETKIGGSLTATRNTTASRSRSRKLSVSAISSSWHEMNAEQMGIQQECIEGHPSAMPVASFSALFAFRSFLTRSLVSSTNSQICSLSRVINNWSKWSSSMSKSSP